MQGEEGRGVGGFGRLVVCRELCQGEPRAPIVLQIVHVGSQILLNHGVEARGLVVGFRVKGGRRTAADLQSLTEASPEVRGELGVAVRHNRLRQAMQAEHPLEEEVCQILRIHTTPAGNQVALLG